MKLHKANNGYPLALEKDKIEKEWMSDYEVRDDTLEGPQDAGIWPRVPDEAVQPDEHRIPEAGNKWIRDELLQTHEQLRVRQNDGERAEAR